MKIKELTEGHDNFLKNKMVKAIAEYMANWNLEVYSDMVRDDPNTKLKDPSEFCSDPGAIADLFSEAILPEIAKEVSESTVKNIKELLKRAKPEDEEGEGWTGAGVSPGAVTDRDYDYF